MTGDRDWDVGIKSRPLKDCDLSEWEIKKKPVPTQWNDNKSSKKNSIPAAESHINRIYLPWTRAGIYQADKWA